MLGCRLNSPNITFEQNLDALCGRHFNILFKRDPLVTQPEETVDPYQVLRQLSEVYF